MQSFQKKLKNVAGKPFLKVYANAFSYNVKHSPKLFFTSSCSSYAYCELKLVPKSIVFNKRFKNVADELGDAADDSDVLRAQMRCVFDSCNDILGG